MLDWGVHAVEGGTVIIDDDDGDKRGAAYGVSVRVQTPEGRVYLYAHLSENCVNLGDKIETGQLIGVMGDSGNSFGAHLHLGVYRVSPTGVRLAAGNGYKGYLDPEKESA
jgi:murein DD-endopeptidase MepM/ murein hydrolase activator NlpD